MRWLADGYTRVQSLFEQLRVARANLYSAEETLRLTRQRKQMGVGVLFEDIQAQQELLKVRTDLVDIVTELNQRRTPCCTAWAPLCTALAAAWLRAPQERSRQWLTLSRTCRAGARERTRFPSGRIANLRRFDGLITPSGSVSLL